MSDNYAVTSLMQSKHYFEKELKKNIEAEDDLAKKLLLYKKDSEEFKKRIADIDGALKLLEFAK